MENGDISNGVSARLLVVFEGTIATIEDRLTEQKRAFYLKSHRWQRAASCWSVDMLTTKRFWDMTFRLSQTIDIVTYLDEREAEHIQVRLDQLGLPFGNFWATTLEELCREILPNPSVTTILDADPKRVFTYGGKGRQTWT